MSALIPTHEYDELPEMRSDPPEPQDYDSVDVDRASYPLLLAHLHDCEVLGSEPSKEEATNALYHLRGLFNAYGVTELELTDEEQDAHDKGELHTFE